ncbi:Leucine rich repeat [Carpediemonas membranifera]|uniref:Leucine rich repeat n=1 Tax=Carpediemonas membranifera TaxID=201153 RepID=A0A8J6AVT5_9EUKA|nr:Leucine rich repeat [Carpediemonas membranifera]|eukprot:KAG9393770.1 Leucine rich repeat [Carpediemonas membranifera]
MGTLTTNMIISRTKVSDLGQVRNLNIWGNDLSDVSVVRQMKNVEVLSLSVNNIDTLCDFSFCPKLRELYLRRNKVQELYEILYLTKLSGLKTLWLSDNPIAQKPDYRKFVIANLQNLEKLDDKPIEDEERRNARAAGLTNAVRIPADREQPAGTGMSVEEVTPAMAPRADPDPRREAFKAPESHFAPPPQGHAIQSMTSDLPPSAMPERVIAQMPAARVRATVGRSDSRQSVGGPPPGHVISHAPNPVRQPVERQPLDRQSSSRELRVDGEDFARQDAVFHAVVTLLPELSQAQLQMLQTMVEKKLKRDWR